MPDLINEILQAGYDFPTNAKKWTPKEILDWKLGSKKYYRDLLGDAAKNTVKGITPVSGITTLGKIGLTAKRANPIGAVSSIFLDAEPANSGEDAYFTGVRAGKEWAKNNRPPSTEYAFPVVYEPGSTIFVEGQTRYIYVPIPPARRLKALAAKADDAPIKTKRVPQISVETSFRSKIWGEILHDPVSPYKYEATEFDSSKFSRQLEKNSEAAEKKLSAWLVDNKPATIKDQSIVFIDWYDFDGGSKEIESLCGLENISTLYDSFFVRSKNAIRPVVSMVPREIKTKKVSINASKYEEPKFNYSNTRGGVANTVSGVDTYPVIVPKDIASGKDDYETITNNAEAFSYLFRCISQLVGEFPIEIEIQDTNLTQSGNQKQKITIPNMAEGIAELLGGSLNTQLYSQALISVAFKTLMQTTKNTIGVSVTQDYAKACAEYFGFEHKEITRKLKVPFNPNEENISKALEDSEIKYESIELTDKKDLNDYLHDLLQAAAIIKGANFKKFNTNNLTKEVKEYLKSLLDENSEATEDNWREFIQQAEAGFTNSPLTNKETPYSRSTAERPRIRDIGEIK